MILQIKIIDDKNNVLKILDHGEWRYPEGELHRKPQAGFETLYEQCDMLWAAVDFAYDDTGYEFHPEDIHVLQKGEDLSVLGVMLQDMKDLDDDWDCNGRILRWFPIEKCYE
jgi:hypothetical protein